MTVVPATTTMKTSATVNQAGRNSGRVMPFAISTMPTRVVKICGPGRGTNREDRAPIRTAPGQRG